MESVMIQKSLPLDPHKHQFLNSDKNSDKSAPEGLETYSVLVVDDDRAMADLFAVILRRAGHRVGGIAGNGREAVNMALKTCPDVVLMDLHMPGLDGLQAAREILASRLVPIVLSTGMVDLSSIQRANDIRLISYLAKPFGPAQLNVAIYLAVAGSRRLTEFDAADAAR
jgi:response regulator NasT